MDRSSRDSDSHSRRWTHISHTLQMLKGKVAEKTVGMQKLATLIEDDDVGTAELDRNSVGAQNSNVMTWSYLFGEVESFFQKETELKEMKLGGALDNRTQKAFDLIQKISSRANLGLPRLPMKTVYDFIISKLDNKLYVDCFGTNLIDMLQAFLSVRLYTSTVNGDGWSRIITVLIKLYHGKNTIASSKILLNLNTAIDFGSNHPSVISVLRTQVIEFYKTFSFTDDRRNNKYLPTGFVHKGIIILCQKNALEFRGILCKFGERFIPSVLANISASVNDEEEADIAELLLVQLKLHHPCDVSSSSNAFYADEPATWDSTLKTMYSYCIETIEDVARRFIYSTSVLSAVLLELAAKCTRQISIAYPRCDEAGISDDMPPAKKIMSFRTFQSIVCDQAQSAKTPSKSHIIWMQYITAVLYDFPDVVETHLIFQSLFQFGLALLNSTLVTHKEVFIFFRSLLYGEKHLLKLNVLRERSASWNHVWDLTVKYISLNEAKPEALELLRTLMVEIQPVNINSFLLLYINQSLRPTEPSVNALSEYLVRCSLPKQMKRSPVARFADGQVENEEDLGKEFTCPRLALIKWIINAANVGKHPYPWTNNHYCQTALVLVSLIIRRSHILFQTEYPNWPDGVFRITDTDVDIKRVALQVGRNDFETALVRNCFEPIPTEASDAASLRKCDDLNIEDRGTFNVLESLGDYLYECLNENYDKWRQSDNKPVGKTQADFMKKFEQLFTKTAIILNVVNFLEKYNICNGDSFRFRSNLDKLFTNVFGGFTQAAVEFMKGTGRNADHVRCIVRTMRMLFSSTHLCDKMKKMLAVKYPQTLTLQLKKVFRSCLQHYIEKHAKDGTDCIIIFNSESHHKDEVRHHRERIIEEDEDQNYDEDVITDTRFLELTSLDALKCLTEYGLICDYKCELFEELINDLMSDPERRSDNERQIAFRLTNQFHFDLCVTMLLKTIRVISAGSSGSLLNPTLNILQVMCRKYFSNPDCAKQLWCLFRKLTPLVANQLEVLLKKKFMTLVGTLSGYLNNSPIDCSKSAFVMLSELAECDPFLIWSSFTRKVEDNISWILLNIPDCFTNPSHQFRSFATDAIHSMFAYQGRLDRISVDKSVDLEALMRSSAERIKVFYKKVCDSLKAAYNVPELTTGILELDESLNRKSLLISCLAKLVFAYSWNQKKAIFGLISVIREKKIPVTLTNRALMNMNSSSTKILECQLSYVLKKWLKMDYDMKDFPFQLFGCESIVEFFTKFKREITVQYFLNNKLNLLLKTMEDMDFEGTQAVRECYGTLIGTLAPGLVALQSKRKPSLFDSKHLETVKQCNKMLVHMCSGTNRPEALLMARLGDIVLTLVSLSSDSTLTEQLKCPRLRFPKLKYPCYSEEEINDGLKYLKDGLTPFEEFTIIGYIAQNCPKSLFYVLINLIRPVHVTHDEFEKVRRLQQFSYFVKLLMNEPPAIFDKMGAYVCHFVVHAYLRLLRSEEEIVVHAVIHYLDAFINRLITESQFEEVTIHYRLIVNRLVSVVLRFPKLTDIAMVPLNLLLKTYGEMFANCIVGLDPFPNDVGAFQEFRNIQSMKKYGARRHEWGLMKELRNCVDEVDSANGVCSKERLQFVKTLLSSKKAEFEGSVKALEGKKFWAECKSDVVHNLIQMLVRVITHSRDNEEIEEACRCLGEIGPIDLAILVLPPYDRSVKLDSAVTTITNIIETVASYLMSDDIQLVRLTGEVLESLLQLTECVEFVQKDISTSSPRLDSILTPFKSKETSKFPTRVDESLLGRKLMFSEMNEFVDYQTWVVTLTCNIIECMTPNNLVSRILPLCRIKSDFCAYVLPFVFFALLLGGKGNPLVRKHVSNYFQTFLNNFNTQNQSNSQPSRCVTPTNDGGIQRCSIYLNKLAIRSLIEVVQFLRQHLIPQEFKGSVPCTPWDNNLWLEVSYLDLAKAAQFCGAYLTSVLYAEIYSFECQDDQTRLANNDELQFYSQETTSYPRNRRQASEIEKILLKAYTSIGESDAIYSCGSARFSDSLSNIQQLQQQQQWNRALCFFDSSVGDRSMDTSSSQVGTCEAMKELGLCNTLWTYIQGIHGGGDMTLPGLSEVQYECGWRLSKWDFNCNKAAYLQTCSSPKALQSTTIQKHLYESICFGLANDRLSHNESIRRGLNSIVHDLRHASLESAGNLYAFLSKFQMVRVIEDFFQESESLAPLVGKWKLQDRFGYSDFKYHEPILHLRSVLLDTCRLHHNPLRSFDIDIAFDDCVLELVVKARDSKSLEIAENSVLKVSSMANKIRKKLETAKNFWARGDQDIARLILGEVIKQKANEDTDVYPSLLLLYGIWLSETKADRPSIILEQYLQRSCELYEARKQHINLQEIANAHTVLARYADAQYQIVTNYMKSDLFQEKINQYERAKDELKHTSRDSSKDNDTKKSEAIIRKQSSIDHNEIQALLSEKKKFLLLALGHYLRGLSYSNDHDLLIFRAFALWLENVDQKDDLFASASKIVGEEKLVSYKYLNVLHQLSARMATGNAATSVIINNILLKCAKEHPYHTLPVLLTQALLHKDKELIRTNAKKVVEDRVRAAQLLIDILKQDKENKLGELVQKMEKLWIALITLANVQESKNAENLRRPLPSSSQLRVLKNMSDVLVPTISIPVSATSSYNIVGVQSFELFYTMVGGINSPKRITCLGTNGVKYNMLLKGQDDLRQDAVMQQVFAVMNKLLQAEPSTKSRRLQIRTYKVVPLSQRSGILEWCENTQTFGDYLVGSGTEQNPGAHCLYRPQDYKPTECRKKMNEVRDCRDNLKKRTVFLNILEHFKPVFRHFFFENFKDAGTYFERRLAYTRSVATSSMVGYILGLGDRHVLNILVDKTTAEFIHIDLGVAFEQGRILPTPETIPFRLTRDVVDGMGVSGVEGVFRRSCEMTLDVLRTNAEIILTILEVLLYDPLYIWTVTADRMQKVQPGGADSSVATRRSLSLITGENTENAPKERNNSAARVLLRLKQKLMGIEEGGSSGSSLSVPGHVALLIQTALDTDRHSKLFPGWQPYL